MKDKKVPLFADPIKQQILLDAIANNEEIDVRKIMFGLAVDENPDRNVSKLSVNEKGEIK